VHDEKWLSYENYIGAWYVGSLDIAQNFIFFSYRDKLRCTCMREIIDY